jgi:hypothetical protein
LHSNSKMLFSKLVSLYNKNKNTPAGLSSHRGFISLLRDIYFKHITMENIISLISMIVITILPFRGQDVMNGTSNSIQAGSFFYSTFSPENIDGYLKKGKKKAKKKSNKKPETIIMVNNVSNKKIKLLSDSISRSIGVPPELIREIGDNESKWTFIRSKSGGPGKGDLQVIDNTFKHWYNKLHLKGGYTRSNYLIVSIHYFKYCYDLEKSWRKARFIYARGRWRDESTWTAMERAFMHKINWEKYDK